MDCNVISLLLYASECRSVFFAGEEIWGRKDVVLQKDAGDRMGWTSNQQGSFEELLFKLRKKKTSFENDGRGHMAFT